MNITLHKILLGMKMPVSFSISRERAYTFYYHTLEPIPAYIDTWARGVVPMTDNNLLVDQNPFDRLLCKSVSELKSPPTDDKLVTHFCSMCVL